MGDGSVGWVLDPGEPDGRAPSIRREGNRCRFFMVDEWMHRWMGLVVSSSLHREELLRAQSW